MKQELLIIGILTLSLTACYDQFDDTTTTTFPEKPEVYVDAHLIGDVKLGDDTKINQFSINVNENSALIENGYINMSLDFVNELSQFIEINTNSGESAIAVLPIHRNATTYASLYLFPGHEEMADIANRAFDFELSTLGAISVPESVFSSASNVNAQYRTIENEKLVNQLGHRGSGPSGETWVIDINTAFEFRFNDGNENPVQMPDNTQVQLDFNNQFTSTDQVLLQLDESEGIWRFVEYLNNLNSVKLSKSGWYSIAKVQPAVIVRSVFKIGTKPVSFQTFTLGNDELMVNVRSVSSGEWLALVPTGESIDVKLFSPCGALTESVNFEAVSEDSYLPSFQFQESQSFFNIIADVIDCSGSINEAPGFIFTNGGTQQTYTFANTPDVFIPVCEGPFEISATNLQSGEVGPTIDWNPENAFSLDFLSDCMSLEDGFAFVSIGDEEIILEDLNVSIDQGNTTFWTSNGIFKFILRGTDVKRYLENEVNININDPNFGPQGYYIACENSDLGCGITKCEMTHFAENEGEWYRVQFEGEIWVRTIDVPVAGYKPIRGVILTKK